VHLFERTAEDAGCLTKLLANFGLRSHETNLVEFLCSNYFANLLAQSPTIEMQLLELIAGGMNKIPKRALLSRGCIESSEQSAQSPVLGEVVVLDRKYAGQKQ